MASWRKLTVPAAFAFIIFSFSVNSVITRYLVSGDLLGPFQLTIIRFVSGFATLQLMLSGFSGSFRRTKVGPLDLVGGISLGLYAFAISFGYFFIPAGAGALVFYSMVVITMSSYSVVIDRERLTASFLLGQLLGILGIVVVTFGGLGSASLQGVALMVLTGTSWGLYSVFARKSANYFGYTYNSFLLFGGLCMGLTLYTLPQAGAGPWTGIAPTNLALALYMGTVSTALSYVVWNKVLKKISASQGGLAQLLVPVLTSGLGVLFLSEKITVTLALGGALILASIYVNSQRKTGRRPSST